MIRSIVRLIEKFSAESIESTIVEMCHLVRHLIQGVLQACEDPELVLVSTREIAQTLVEKVQERFTKSEVTVSPQLILLVQVLTKLVRIIMLLSNRQILHSLIAYTHSNINLSRCLSRLSDILLQIEACKSGQELQNIPVEITKMCFGDFTAASSTVEPTVYNVLTDLCELVMMLVTLKSTLTI